MITIRKNQISVMNIQYGYYPLEKFLDDAVMAEVNHIELWGGSTFPLGGYDIQRCVSYQTSDREARVGFSVLHP